MPRQRERHADGRVQVRAGEMPDRVDHRHDHEAERECNAEMSECARVRVDHDRAGSDENERERPDRLGEERKRRRRSGHQATAGQGEAIRLPTRASAPGASR